MAKRQKRRTECAPTVSIENCTLTGGTTSSIDALARALEANANAILELSKSVSRPNSLIYVGGNRE